MTSSSSNASIHLVSTTVSDEHKGNMHGGTEKNGHVVRETVAIVRVDSDLLGEEARPSDEAVAQRVLRQIDRVLIPPLMIGYALVIYDKALLGSAVLLGMATDLQLSVPDTSTTPPSMDTTRLSWALSILYFGQLLGSYPTVYLVQHFPRRLVLGPAVLAWAATCAATAAITTWQGLLVQRFFLGLTESIIPPAIMTTVSGFYTQPEQALRQAWWVSAPGYAGLVGAVLNFGWAQLTHAPLHPWQYAYLLAGGLTAGFGIWCFLCAPDSPADAWFLTPEERVVAVERLRGGQTGIHNADIKRYQVREAAKDVRVGLVFLLALCASSANGAILAFGPLMVTTFGYSNTESILLQIPFCAVPALGVPLAGWWCARHRDSRLPVLGASTLVVVAGYVVMWKSTWGYHAVVPVLGHVLSGFFGIQMAMIISVAAANVAGETKKSFVAAAVFVAFTVGNIIGPQLMKSQTKNEHYPDLWKAALVFQACAVVCAAVLFGVMGRENRRRDGLGLDPGEKARMAFKDLTDRENLHFRYAL